MLGAPVAAMIVRATERIREASAEQGAAASPPAPVPAVDTT
jgi:hypothetical protein